MIDNISGGPAFPAKCSYNGEGKIVGWQTGGASGWETGMSLRDYFAAQAMMQGMAVLVASDHNLNAYQLGTLAKTAYLAADAMLEARK